MLSLNPDDYMAGVALWGAVEPVYNTSKHAAERGIHVHARKVDARRKDIDHTYDAVKLEVRKDLFEYEKVIVTGDTAVAYYISRFLKRELTSLFCPYCSTPHLDSDWFAVKPHRVHLCHGCNRFFRELSRSVSNPLEAVRHMFGDLEASRPPKRAKKSLSITQSDYKGGLQIWASNPALLWTAARSEDEGIHVHGWVDNEIEPTIDDTYDRVVIDGIDLDEQQLRHFMAQSSLRYMKSKIVSLKCPTCHTPIFDQHDAAFRPKREHECSKCGTRFSNPGRRKLVVSNPFIDTLAMLHRARTVS